MAEFDIQKIEDTNKNKQVDIDELSIYFSNNIKTVDDTKKLAEELKKENGEIKSAVEGCIQKFYNENKYKSKSNLTPDELKILKLGEELGIKKDENKKYEEFLGDQEEGIRDFITEESLKPGVSVDEVKNAVNQRYWNVIGENVKNIFKKESEDDQPDEHVTNTQYVWKPLKYGIKDIYNKKDEVINNLVDEIFSQKNTGENTTKEEKIQNTQIEQANVTKEKLPIINSDHTQLGILEEEDIPVGVINKNIISGTTEQKTLHIIGEEIKKEEIKKEKQENTDQILEEKCVDDIQEVKTHIDEVNNLLNTKALPRSTAVEESNIIDNTRKETIEKLLKKALTLVNTKNTSLPNILHANKKEKIMGLLNSIEVKTKEIDLKIDSKKSELLYGRQPYENLKEEIQKVKKTWELIPIHAIAVPVGKTRDIYITPEIKLEKEEALQRLETQKILLNIQKQEGKIKGIEITEDATKVELKTIINETDELIETVRGELEKPITEEYKKSLEEAVKRLEAKKTILELKKIEGELKLVNESTGGKKISMETMIPIRIKFLEKTKEIREIMKTQISDYTETEKKYIENMKPISIRFDIENLEEEIQKLEEKSQEKMDTAEWNKMETKLIDLVKDAKEIVLTTSNNEYKKPLEKAIARLEAKKPILELKKIEGELKVETENNTGKIVTMSKLIPREIRLNLLEKTKKINEIIETKASDYTETEKRYIEDMKPIAIRLEIENIEEEIQKLEKKSQEKIDTAEWNKMETRLIDLVKDAKEIVLTTSNNEYKKPLEKAIARLEAKKSILELKKIEGELKVRNESTGGKKISMETMIPIRIKFLEIEKKLNEITKNNTSEYTETEKKYIENMKPITTRLELENMEEEIQKLEKLSVEKVNKEVWNKMETRLIELVINAKDIAIKTSNENEYKKSLEEAIARLKAKKPILELKRMEGELKTETGNNTGKAVTMSKLIPREIRLNFLEKAKKINEIMNTKISDYTEIEKKYIENMKPITTRLELENMEEEIQKLEELSVEKVNKEVWNKMESRLIELLISAKNVMLTTSNSEYKKPLEEVIARLEAKKMILELKIMEGELKVENESTGGKKISMETMIPIRIKFLETERKVRELVKLNADDYTQEEKNYVEKMKPITTRLELENIEEEIEIMEKNPEGKLEKTEWNKLEARVVELLINAKNVVLTTSNSEYKKILEEGIAKLEAKKTILELKKIEGELKVENESVGSKKTPMESIIPREIRLNFLEKTKKIAEGMKLKTTDYTETEKRYIENIKPIAIRFDIENIEEEIDLMKKKPKEAITKTEWNKLEARAIELLRNAKNIVITISNNEYKKPLEEAIARLEAKKTILELKKKEGEIIKKQEVKGREISFKDLGAHETSGGKIKSQEKNNTQQDYSLQQNEFSEFIQTFKITERNNQEEIGGMNTTQKEAVLDTKKVLENDKKILNEINQEKQKILSGNNDIKIERETLEALQITIQSSIEPYVKYNYLEGKGQITGWTKMFYTPNGKIYKTETVSDISKVKDIQDKKIPFNTLINRYKQKQEIYEKSIRVLKNNTQKVIEMKRKDKHNNVHLQDKELVKELLNIAVDSASVALDTGLNESVINNQKETSKYREEVNNNITIQESSQQELNKNLSEFTDNIMIAAAQETPKTLAQDKAKNALKNVIEAEKLAKGLDDPRYPQIKSAIIKTNDLIVKLNKQKSDTEKVQITPPELANKERLGDVNTEITAAKNTITQSNNFMKSLLESKSTKSNNKGFADTISNLTTSKEKLEKLSLANPSNKEIIEEINKLKIKINNIEKTQSIEHEIVAWYERIEKGEEKAYHNIPSMANFFRNVFEKRTIRQESLEDEKRNDLWKSFFINDEVREWSLSHAANVVNGMISKGGFTLEENYFDKFGNLLKDAPKEDRKKIPQGKTIYATNSLKTQLEDRFKILNARSPFTSDFKKFLKNKLGIDIQQTKKNNETLASK